MSSMMPVILSGGSGTRLWPLSREHFPKQLLALTGTHTLLQQTAMRLDGLNDVLAPIVVCNEEHRFLVAEQFRQIERRPQAILLEPVGRNTAPALTLAALACSNPDTVLLVMPADHVIRDDVAFRHAVQAGLAEASTGWLVTFGIVPTRSETGYGYIHKGAKRPSGASYAIRQFVEKPDQATAQSYVTSGEYLWNSGMFMLTARCWLEELQRHHPGIAAACREAWSRAERDLGFLRVGRQAFEGCPSESIDYAVMEKTDKAVVVPLDAGWSDIGAWSSLWETSTQNQEGNVIEGDVATVDTRNSLVVAKSRLVAAVGLEDMIVIETADAVLVARKDAAQQVREVVARLKKENRSEHVMHRRVYRPWGHYEGVDIGERYQVKRITVNPGAALSLQTHQRRAEHWVVVRGVARVTRGDEVLELGENQSTYIPIGMKHRLENPATHPLEIIEIQSGDYLGEDDIVRYEDRYNR